MKIHGFLNHLEEDKELTFSIHFNNQNDGKKVIFRNNKLIVLIKGPPYFNRGEEIYDGFIRAIALANNPVINQPPNEIEICEEGQGKIN